MSFLTVEDINSNLMSPVNDYYTIDTADIGTDEFSDIKLDFCIVSHSINGDNHTFTFRIVDTLFAGYWCTNSNGEYLDSRIDPNTKLFTVITDDTSILIHVYLCNFKISASPLSRSVINDDDSVFYITKNQLGATKTIKMFNVVEGRNYNTNVTIEEGVVSIGAFNYILFLLCKTDFKCNLNQVLTVGKVNKVRLNTDEDYLPEGSLTDENLLDITVTVDDEVIPVYYDENIQDYCFDLDLTSKTENNSIKCTVNVNESKYVNPTSIETHLKCKYLQISNFTDLINEIIYGSQIIELTDNFSLLSRINVNHDLVIYAGEHELDFNGFGFNILNKSTFKLNNCNVVKADSAIVQGLQTRVDLTSCTFTNCTSSNYNNLGSVIYCDVDLESLTDDVDFTTNIAGCTFNNNTCCLFHGGELNIINSRLHNNDADYVDINNPALVYQTDGSCTITDSVFDISYTSNALCGNNINIGFGQALILCGQTALINTCNIEQLSQNDNILFFDTPYNNRSHVFAKYYYPQISECVYSSPLVNMEDKSICYAVSGNDWVYKTNVQVTRVSMNNENTYNPLEE